MEQKERGRERGEGNRKVDSDGIKSSD